MVKKEASERKRRSPPSAPKATLRKIKKSKTVVAPRPHPPLDCSELTCDIHSKRAFEFICIHHECLRELCAICILDHKHHIDEIHPLAEVVQKNLESCEDSKLRELQTSLIKNQQYSIQDLETLETKMKNLLVSTIGNLKEKLLEENQKTMKFLDTYSEIRYRFLQEQKAVEKLDAKSLSCLKTIMKSQRKMKLNKFVIEENLINKQLEKVLTNNITLVAQGCNINSTNRDVPKYLHWFEWDKRDLHLFDVVNYSHRVLKLGVYFKIPPFSRSIIIPDGRIFLMGGEDADNGAKREVYYFNINSMASDNTLHSRANMPHKKYDFSICHLKGFIYAICGKGHDLEVVDTCDRYDVAKDTWTSLARVHKKRYAASAVSAAEIDKIYLFGGRSSQNNQMAEEIEEYSVETNVWTIIQLRNQNAFVPVEVCSAVQVAPGQIIVFGGSDSSVHDTSTTYIFEFPEFRVEKIGSLKKAHVFVNTPFVYGDHVFAIGNEYYVKNRNIHRFSISKHEWDLIY